MNKLTTQHQFLELEPGPKMLLEALRHYGTLELKGPDNCPTIMAWAKELNLGNVYTSDNTAWCGLFIALLATRSGYEVPSNPLWALNWAKFGEASKIAKLGYVMVFKRVVNNKLIGGHVALYVGEDKDCYHILGGNQADQVGIVRILKSRVHAIRKPIYKIAEPDNIRVIMLGNTGPISQNEA